MNTKKVFSITNGPSRDRIWDHVKFQMDPDVDLPLVFTLEGVGEVRNLWISSVRHEDGSGYSFIITGEIDELAGRSQFKAYYNAKRRNGAMTILDFSPKT